MQLCRLEVAVVPGAEGFVVLCSWGSTVLCCGAALPPLQHSCSLPAAPWTLMHRLDAGTAAQNNVFWALKST